MARYTLTNPAIRVKGSSGGATFQVSGALSVIRARKIPLAKYTAKTSRVRNIFEATAQRWRQRNASQKLTFSTNAPGYPRVDSFGIAYNLTGQQMQQSLNTRAPYITLSPQNTLVAAVAAPSNVIASIIANWNTNTVKFETLATTVPAGFDLMIFASPPVNAGITSMSIESMKLVVRYSAGGSTTTNVYGQYKLVYPDFEELAGQKVFAIFRWVQRTSAQVRKELSGFTNVIT